MTLSSKSLKRLDSIIPPRPGAPIPPDSPSPTKVQAFRPHLPTPPQTLNRKRGRTSSSTLDLKSVSTPTRTVKRLKGSRGQPLDIFTPEEPLSVASSRLSFVSSARADEESWLADQPVSPAFQTPRPQRIQNRTPSLWSKNGDSESGVFSSSENSDSEDGLQEPPSPQKSKSNLRSTPISRSVIWTERDSPSTSMPHNSRGDKLNNFAPPLHSDLILRSNDLRPVSFHTDTHTMFEASSVIRNIASEIGSTRMKDSRPLVMVTIKEPAEALHNLLSLIYHRDDPALHPTITSGEELDTLIKLVKRYRVASGLHILCTTYLRDLAIHEPLRAYGLACKHDLKSEQVWTARETLRINLKKGDITHDMASCDRKHIQSLVKLHTRAASKAHQLIASARSWDEMCCSGEYCQDGVAEWWNQFVIMSRAELKARPNSGSIFSPFFLTTCVRMANQSCNECTMHFLMPKVQHRLGRLKDDVDAMMLTL